MSTKISELPALVGAIPATNDVPIVSSGVTYRTTLGTAAAAATTDFINQTDLDDATVGFYSGKGDLQVGSGVGTTVLLSVGANNQIIVADSSTSSGLRWRNPIDVQTVADANATITSGKNAIHLTSALTAARVYTLPAASGYLAGTTLTFTDIQNTITSANTVTLQRAGSDTINGATSMVISTAGASPVLVSDGSSKWTMDVRGIARGGTGAITAAAAAVNIVNGNPIAPSTVGVSANGAASSSPATLTGTWYSGGSATTTKPQLLLEPTGTTSTAWSTAGTGIGVNAASGFTGNLLDLKVNNSSVAQIDQNGIIKASGGGLYVFGSTTAGTILGAFSQYNVRLHPDIPIYWGSTSYGAVPDCGINRHATNTVSIAATGTLTKSGGAFGDLALRCLKPDSTNTAAGTTGAQTINKSAGSVNFAAAATSLVVTNSLVTAASNIIAIVNTNDSTAIVKNVVAASGSFTITLSAAATAETKVSFFVLN